MSQKKIPLVEAFGPTIQGEGSVIGLQTYFLRFGLCDYRCDMCDSMHAVDPMEVKKNAMWMTQSEIFDHFMKKVYVPQTTQWITFSGGNPAIHDLNDLIYMLKSVGFRISVETQGTKFPDWLCKVDQLTISPKGPGMGERTDFNVLDKFVNYVVESQVESFLLPDLKVVIFDQRDIEFAASVFERYKDQISSDHWYLSLGNFDPPGLDGSPLPDYDYTSHVMKLIGAYKMLSQDILIHPVLRHARYLPQWHVFVFGNDKGH